jgi:hypothetical protein
MFTPGSPKAGHYSGAAVGVEERGGGAALSPCRFIIIPSLSSHPEPVEGPAALPFRNHPELAEGRSFFYVFKAVPLKPT